MRTAGGQSLRQILCFALIAGSLPAFAADLPGVENADRARSNYILNCQGCHGPNGEGSVRGLVPRMQGFLGNFLRVEGGRAFMVQVPGSANAPLSDAALAEVLNWLLPTISGDELPADFRPYTASEVGELRKTPAIDVDVRRAALIAEMQQEDAARPGS